MTHGDVAHMTEESRHGDAHAQLAHTQAELAKARAELAVKNAELAALRALVPSEGVPPQRAV